MLKQLEESSLVVEKIREKIAALKGENITRHGATYTISDLQDMISETKLSKERMTERIDWIRERIAIETKVRLPCRLSVPYCRAVSNSFFSQGQVRCREPCARLWP